MDDYEISNLYEPKNEWSSRLVTILTPLIYEGFYSIFNESWTLCLENDEEEKYLMTFQNFLGRIVKWNQTLIEEETKRIVEKSKCDYLDDLITCVHIIHLKALTSIRVSNKQKKIDLDIPNLSDFIHKVYICCARKLYQNVYLFEKDVGSLQQQRHMRVIETIIKESILTVIRDSIPIETILRAYMDETQEEEVVEKEEEIIEKDEGYDDVDKDDNDDKKQDKQEDNNDDKLDEYKQSIVVDKKENDDNDEKEVKTIDDDQKSVVNEKITISTEEPEQKKDVVKEETIPEPSLVPSPRPEERQEPEPVSAPVAPPTPISTPLLTAPSTPTSSSVSEKTQTLKFNENDKVLDLGTNKSEIISAPKTIERLEQISEERNQQRKEEEEEDNDDDKIKIHTDNINLDINEIQDISPKINIKEDSVLNDIEVL